MSSGLKVTRFTIVWTNALLWRLAFMIGVFSMLVPKLEIGNRSIGVDDLLVLAVGGLLALAITRQGHVKLPLMFWAVVGLLFTFVVFFVFFGSLNSIRNVGYLRPPTELWQYVKRAVFFMVGYFLVLSNKDGASYGYRLLLWGILLVCLVGVVQILGGPPAELTAKAYGHNPIHITRMLDRPISSRRIIGVTENPLAWGGLCAFFMAVAFPVILLRRQIADGGLYKLALFCVLLAGVNVMFAGSRASIVAAIFGMAVIFGKFLWTQSISSLRKLLTAGGITGVFVLMMIALSERIGNIIYRFDVLVEQGGGNRMHQIKMGLLQLDSPLDWLIGIGNAAQREFVLSIGIDSEPAYLLVNYGLLGFMLLITILVVVFLTGRHLASLSDTSSRIVGLAVIGGLASYMVSWLGTYFYQEVIVGGVPWLLFGLAVALATKFSRHHHENAFQTHVAR